jgi:hypothetical protein
MIKQAALLVAVLAASSVAQEDRGRSWRDSETLRKTPTEAPGAPAVSGRPALNAVGDATYTAYFLRDGTMHHWLRGFDVVYDPKNPKEVPHKLFISGGFAPIAERQNSYNKWVKDNELTRDTSIPTYINPSGSLNLRTLDIPRYKFKVELNALWRVFQVDCAAADLTKELDVCRTSLQDFRSDLNQAFPNSGLKERALQLEKIKETLAVFAAEVERAKRPALSVHPVDEELFREVYETDHLEPDSLPDGLLKKLSTVESYARSQLDEALLLRKALK